MSLEASALLNRAYRTLRDPIERMAYLIRLETGQKEIAAKAPEDLLEEVFELQEALESYRKGTAGPAQETDRRTLADEQARLRERLARLDGELQRLAMEWDQAVERDGDAATPVKRELIASMQDRLASRKYLVNTIEDIALTLEGRSDAKDRRH